MKQKREIAAAFMAAAMMLQAIPLTAHADSEWSKFDSKHTSFCTSGISAPKEPENDEDAWTGSYVYYGQYENQPVKYRVLAPKTYRFGGKTMLLDCDTTLFQHIFQHYLGPFDENTWNESLLYKALNTNDDAFLKTSFTNAEANAIAESTIIGNGSEYVTEYLYNNFKYDEPLNGDKIFVLDVEDVSNTAYGYNLNDSESGSRKKKNFLDPDKDVHGWWLRSINSISATGYVGNYGGCILLADIANENVEVSPALNVDLSSVLFASQVNDETDTYGKEYKLTLKDSGTKLNLGTFTRSGDTVTVSYTVTDSTPNNDITANTASVMIVGANETVKYYAPLTGDFSAENGSGSFDLPDNYNVTDKIYIFAEDVNSQYETDYASEMAEIKLPYEGDTTPSAVLEDDGTLIISGTFDRKSGSMNMGDYEIIHAYANNDAVKTVVCKPNTVFQGSCTYAFYDFKATKIDLSNVTWDNVINMYGMFARCYNLKSVDLSGIDTSKVIDMSGMFYNCSDLTDLDVSGFDTSNVINMYGMFQYCYNLTSLDVSGFNTSNVTNMNMMFYSCQNLSVLDVHGFDISNVTNMSSMFEGCRSLTSLDASEFDTSNVTNMSSMFKDCRSLTSLDISGFDTSNVTNMNRMFYYCQNLSVLDVHGFDTSNVTNMSNMFGSCKALKELDISSFNTKSVTDTTSMFYNCSELKTIYASDNFNLQGVTNSKNMFLDSYNLVGGNGTAYADNGINVNGDYAVIDSETQKGYFTKEPTRLSEPKYMQTAAKDGKNYTRFVFVKEKAELQGKSKAVFSADLDGNTKTFETNTYYTGMTSNDEYYRPISSDKVLFIVTVSSENSLDGLTCELDFK